MKIFKVPLDLSLMSYLENAHSDLVQAAKIAHLEKHPEAENLSQLIDSLEEIDCRLQDNLSLKQKERTS